MPTLETAIAELGPIGKRIAPKLKKLGLATVRDLLLYFPTRHDDFRVITPIANLKCDLETTVQGIVRHIASRRTFRKHMIITEAIVEDKTGALRVIWFQQPYIGKIIKAGMNISLAGTVNYGAAGLEMRNPSFETSTTTHTARLVPVYSLTAGITQKQIRTLIAKILPLAKNLTDPLPQATIKTERLLPLPRAAALFHFPPNDQAIAAARCRLAFDEMFFLQLTNQLRRYHWSQQRAQPIPFQKEIIRAQTAHMPFKLTQAQKRACWEIFQDLERPRPMTRLLEGDVGSGKTAVAALAAAAVAKAGWQTVILAPTDILARQHFETFAKLLPDITIALLTRTAAKIANADGNAMRIMRKHANDANNIEIAENANARKKLLPKISQSPIIVGTHALLQKYINLPRLALLIIDEQQRFGVEQRAALLRNANYAKICEYCEDNQKENQQQYNYIIEQELSYVLNGIFFEIQREIGRFGRERQYADLLEKKLTEKQITYRRESALPIGGRKSNFADFIIEDRILIELKTKPYLTKEDYMQTMRYLQTANLKLGLLVNFRQEYLKPKRVLNAKFASFASPSHHSHRLTPHLLSMTATPIPRSLALTMMSDLDLSVINELPPGRKPIGTHIVPQAKRERAYEFIRQEMKQKHQVYVICPLIDPSDILGVKAATQTFEELREVFKEFSLGLLHGRLSATKKETMRQDFWSGKIDMLIATSVVEVGVDVPNASIMLIEAAERFGLAQLWQLRGRVGRGARASWCFLFTDTDKKEALERLTKLTKAKSGFEVAEADLKLRGPGTLAGADQSGWFQLRYGSLSDLGLIRRCQIISQNLVRQDPSLSSWPLLKTHCEKIISQGGFLPS